MALFTPKLLVISAPSGTGKSSIIGKILSLFAHFQLSVSYTTRTPREGEVNGVHYHFVDQEEFQRRIQQGDFLEWKEVHGNFYGTSKDQVAKSLESGHSILLDIDVQGAMQLQGMKELQAEFIFIDPPSFEELERRLKGRGTESEESLKTRLENAKWELTQKHHYKHLILNDDLNQAICRMILTLLKLTKYKPQGAEPSIEQLEARSYSPELCSELLGHLEGLFSQEKIG